MGTLRGNIRAERRWGIDVHTVLSALVGDELRGLGKHFWEQTVHGVLLLELSGPWAEAPGQGWTRVRAFRPG